MATYSNLCHYGFIGHGLGDVLLSLAIESYEYQEGKWNNCWKSQHEVTPTDFMVRYVDNLQKGGKKWYGQTEFLGMVEAEHTSATTGQCIVCGTDRTVRRQTQCDECSNYVGFGFCTRPVTTELCAHCQLHSFNQHYGQNSLPNVQNPVKR